MFYYASRIVLVLALMFIAAILHQGAINVRNEVTPNVTEEVEILSPSEVKSNI